MTVQEMAERLDLKPVNVSDPDREFRGDYIGDLLSWVMGNAQADDVWITIMSNVNTLAVASLADVSCVLLAENVTLDAETAAAAASRGINVLSTPKSAYDAAVEIHGSILS